MSTNLTVNNNVYAYPDPGDEPGWGTGASGWAQEVTGVLNNLQGSDDIPQTIVNIANNQSSEVIITGLAFNTSSVRSAVIDYSIYISTSSAELAERGQMTIIFKTGATSNYKWTLARTSIGPDNSGVEFFIHDSGQMYYTSSNVAGTSYVGTMHFQAKSLQQ